MDTSRQSKHIALEHLVFCTIEHLADVQHTRGSISPSQHTVTTNQPTSERNKGREGRDKTAFNRNTT